MATATQKIRAGLDKGQHTSKTTATSPTGPNNPRLADLANLRGDLPAIRTQRSAILKAAAAVESIRAGVASHIEAERERLREHFAGIGFQEERTDKGTVKSDLIGATARRSMTDTAIRDMERAARDTYQDTLRGHMAELRAARGRLELMAELWADPVRVLMRSTLESDRRATYADNLSRSGPIEISEAARQAVMTGDKALAAAACSAMDRLDKNARQMLTVTKADIAEAVMAEQLDTAKREIAAAGIYADRAEQALREATGAKVPTTDKLALEHRIMDLERETGRSFEAMLEGGPKVMAESAPNTAEADCTPKKSEAEIKAAALSEALAALAVDDYAKAKRLAEEHGLDIFDSEGND